MSAVDRPATSLIVFGRGLCRSDSGLRLSEASAARVDAALAYITEHAGAFESTTGRVVFSGGYAAAAEGFPPMPVEFREGLLMLRRAERAGINGGDLDKYVQCYAEVESDSTLENLLHIQQAGYLLGADIGPHNPLGLVAHRGHLDRIDYFTRKVLGLDGRSTVHILAGGEDHLGSGMPEPMMYRLTRLACLGARSGRALRNRERLMKRGGELARAVQRWR
jgi:hypothetical protein